MRGKVEICGINTAKLERLSQQEMSDLLHRVKQGDGMAREKLIYGNLKLVLSVVQRFAGRGENMDDLFQVGCIGLIKAIDNFDVNQDVRFSTYGVPMSVRCEKISHCLFGQYGSSLLSIFYRKPIKYFSTFQIVYRKKC